jgi:N-acetylmuramoyl-L-alanine amidase-like protein
MTLRLLAASLLVSLSAEGAVIDERSIAWNQQAFERTGIHRSDAPFEALALSWNAASDATIRLRVSDDGRAWSEWITPNIDEDVTNRSEGRYATAITHFGAAKRYVEFSSTSHVDGLTLTMFAPPPPRRDDRYSVQEFDFGNVKVRSRVDWGCPEGESALRWTPAYSRVTHLIVHHTAGSNSLPDWDAELRNIWFFHTVTNGWGDIGYNFLIDPNGVIYEGRAGGDGAIGAHFSCRNTNTAGVALLGTFSNVSPTKAALDSLERVLGELLKRNQLRSTDIALHVPSGLNLPTISAHRDGNDSPVTCTRTECPGDVLYSMLPAIRSALACLPVSIQAQPLSTSAPATLSVAASGSEPFNYQWYGGASGNTDVPIDGATTSSLAVSPSGTTSYWVRVSNACGSVDSSAAIVNISSPGRRRSAKRS